jgi:hypothetical protein
MNKEDNSKISKISKYVLIGLIVGLASRYIPRKVINNDEVIIIGSIASIVFALLDMYSPSIKINSN